MQCFLTIHIYSWTPYTSTMMDYIRMIIHYVTGPKLSRFGLRSILKTSNGQECRYHICTKWAPWNVYVMCWKGLVTWKILELQISGRSHGQLLRWHHSTSLQRSFAHLEDQCHIMLLHVAESEDVLGNSTHLAHDFWQVSVYL